MKKHKLLIILSLVLIFSISGCSLISLRTPFTDIHKLGVVLKEGSNITIQNTNEIVTVEYLAPTTRRIIWNGESRKIFLFKSSLLNGIYNDHAKFHPNPIGKIKYIDYAESTSIFKSQKEANNMINLFKKNGYEHRKKEHLLILLRTEKIYNFGLKFWKTEYVSIFIKKYEINKKEQTHIK